MGKIARECVPPAEREFPAADRFRRLIFDGIAERAGGKRGEDNAIDITGIKISKVPGSAISDSRPRANAKNLHRRGLSYTPRPRARARARENAVA